VSDDARSITAIIHTKDEERNVARAIRSVRPFVREVLVVDMASADATTAIAAEEGATVLAVPDFGYMEPARALALAEVRTDWVLICDADEVVPATLGAALERIVDADEADVVYLHARTFMLGGEIRGSGWARSEEGHPKFYRVGAVRDFDEIHRQPVARAGVRVIDLGVGDDVCYLHFNYTDVSHFLAKLDRYTTAETLKPGAAGRVASRIAKEIAWRLIAQRAWRDGWRGILLVHLMVTYRLVAWGKTRLLRECGPEADIHEQYDRIARAVASGVHERSAG
jgi:glycosyltransferase involved in cell wall biosynthesis